jgi:hypothetical protein
MYKALYQILKKPQVEVEPVPKLISQLKLNIQNQKMEYLYEKNRNVL